MHEELLLLEILREVREVGHGLHERIESLRESIVALTSVVRAERGAIMALTQAEQAGFAKLDKATDEIAAELVKVRADAAANHPDETDVLALLDHSIARLNGLAADPNNPVPVAPPAPVLAP